MTTCDYWQTEAYIEADMELVAAMDDIPPGFEYPENAHEPCGECEACAVCKVSEDDHECVSVLTANGHGSYCRICGGSLE